MPMLERPELTYALALQQALDAALATKELAKDTSTYAAVPAASESFVLSCKVGKKAAMLPALDI
jgi:hypothetical protein